MLKTISTKIAYECPILRVEERIVKNERKIETHYIVVRQPNVTVFAMNDNHEIIMIQQKRGKNNKIFTEFPSGKLDKFEPTAKETLLLAKQ